MEILLQENTLFYIAQKIRPHHRIHENIGCSMANNDKYFYD